jgi:hypothetical protein
MRIIDAAGSFYEIGRQTGDALREEIRHHLELRQLADQLVDPVQARRLRRFVEITRSQLPELYAELEGTAVGADLPLDHLAALNMPLQFNTELDDDCTNIGFAAGPDGPVHGKNNDGKYADRQKQNPIVCRRIRPDHGIPCVTLTFAGWLGFGDGMNAAGLAMGHSSVGSVFQQSADHVQVRLWAHWGMLTCRSSAAFAAHMAARPTRGKGYAWVVVDADGDALSLEVACPLTQVRRGSHPDGHLHCVNIFQLPALAQADRRKPDMKTLAFARRDTLDSHLADGGAWDAAHMRTLLRSHGEPGVCRHGAHDVSHTEYGYLCLPQAGCLEIAHGYPCAQDFRVVPVIP